MRVRLQVTREISNRILSLTLILFFLYLLIPSFGIISFAETDPIQGQRQEKTELSQRQAQEDKALQEMDGFHYNPGGKRDPFYSKLLTEEKNEAEHQKALGLEQYDLTEINLVGIIWGAEENKGIVETPEGKSYIITVGMPIGKKDGQIKAITKREVVIQEFTTDYFGNHIEKMTILKLMKEEEE